MRVDDHPLRVAALGRDDVRRLARDPRQPEQILEPLRHLAVELLDQQRHRAAQRPRLLPVEAGREDVLLELGLRHREVVLGPAVLLEQRRGDPVDVHVGRLRRQHHRDEQLEWVREGQRDRGVGVLDGESLDHGANARALRTDALPRLANEATRHVPRRAPAAATPRRRAAVRRTRDRAPGSRRS